MADVQTIPTTRWSLRKIAAACIAVWIVIWIIFMAIRFSTLDVRLIPGAGGMLLLMLTAAAALPLVATLLSVMATIQKPAAPMNWVTLGCSIGIMVGQVVMFTASKWM